MPDDEPILLIDLLKAFGTRDDWQFKNYPLEPLVDEEGQVEGCYRTPPAPTG